MKTVFETHLHFSPNWIMMIVSIVYILIGIRILKKRLEKYRSRAQLICPILFMSIGGIGLILFILLFIRQMPTPLFFSAVPFLLLLPLIAFLNFDKAEPISEFVKPIGLFIFVTIFCVITSLAACFLMSDLIQKAQIERFVYDTYQEGNALVVEGAIHDFHPMPETLHDTESFTVDGIAFYYSNHKESFYYSTCAFDGGYITRNGQMVKIWYVEVDGYNYIVRIDLL